MRRTDTSTLRGQNNRILYINADISSSSTKPTFVGPDFTRSMYPGYYFLPEMIQISGVLTFIGPVKYERFIRPMGLRYKKANVTHPELGYVFARPLCLYILLKQVWTINYATHQCTFMCGEYMLTLSTYSVTVQLPIISVKKNPQNPMYTQVCGTSFLHSFI